MSSVSAVDNQTMGKDQFLKLFVTQMRTQNPMDPTGTDDFLAQLAQFSSVEQMSNLNSNFEKLLAAQQGAQATDLVGKTVAYADPESGSAAGGRVTGVQINGDDPVLLLGNRQVNLDWVTAIFE
ncbi:MAG: flagellar hook capping protein [Planctomycetes bacterium]|nr:flagellar hook capping protein [Planctomycetota bacterium]